MSALLPAKSPPEFLTIITVEGIEEILDVAEYD